MSILEIRNFTGKNIVPSFFEKTAKQALKHEKISRKKTIELAFVGKKRMAALNIRYRGIDKATDVLSFGADKFAEKFGNTSLGEIVICPNIVARQAKISGNAFRTELSRVFIHGILHLLGYEHVRDAKKARAMIKKEEEILAGLKK